MPYESYNAITAERRDRILTLTMNRPGQLNAIDEELHEELSRIFYEVAGDDETDVVVFTGAGAAFCAGGDLDWIDAMHGDPKAFARTVWEGKRVINSLLDHRITAGVEFRFGLRSVDLSVGRWKTAVDQSRVDSYAIGFLTPMTDRTDIRKPIA